MLASTSWEPYLNGPHVISEQRLLASKSSRCCHYTKMDILQEIAGGNSDLLDAKSDPLKLRFSPEFANLLFITFFLSFSLKQR